VPFRYEGAPVYTSAVMTGSLICAECSADNDADKRSCTDCGASLAHTCEVCGTANAPTARQ